MSDNSNNVHFSGVRFICSPCFARANTDKIRATNEFYALKMNIIVIVQFYLVVPLCLLYCFLKYIGLFFIEISSMPFLKYILYELKT